MVEPEPKAEPASVPASEPAVESATKSEPAIAPLVGSNPIVEPQAASKKRRKSGGGNKPKLTEKQVDALQQALRQQIADEPEYGKHDAALTWLRDFGLPKIKTKGQAELTVSFSTLYRHVVRPVLWPR